MTAPTLPGNRYPQNVEDLMPAARELPLRDGEQVPSRNRLMREFRIGAPKAEDLRSRLMEEALRRRLADQLGYTPPDGLRPDETPVPPVSDAMHWVPLPPDPEADEDDRFAHNLRTAMAVRGALLAPVAPGSEPAAETGPEPVAAAPVSETVEQVTEVGHPGTKIKVPDAPVVPDEDPAEQVSAEVRQWKRLRWAVRAVLVLGVAASIAGNVLHANDSLIGRIIAAWSPLALLFTIELISRVPIHRPGLAVVRWVATALIAGIAAWVSYWHMVAVAERYGETGGSQFLLPLSVDGLVVVASVCLVELGGRIAAGKGQNR